VSEKNIKRFRKKLNQYKNDLMLEFFESLKDVGIILRLKVCWSLIFRNFRLFNKKGIIK
jgi:hypothetical protein